MLPCRLFKQALEGHEMTMPVLHYFAYIALAATLLFVYAVYLLRSRNFLEVGLIVSATTLAFATLSAIVLAASGITLAARMVDDRVDSFFEFMFANMFSIGITMAFEVLIAGMIALALSPFSPACHQYVFGPAR